MLSQILSDKTQGCGKKYGLWCMSLYWAVLIRIGKVYEIIFDNTESINRKS